MEQVSIPYIFLHNKDLSVFDALLLSYIKDSCNDEYHFTQDNQEIHKTINVKKASIPNVLDKLYKLGYIDIYHENGKRIIVYTYDAPHHLAKSGYIYIMKDEALPYLKIGYSKNPEYREKTLQGDKPTIVLIGKWKGTMSQEQTCHRILAKYRHRGEWFNIDVDKAEDVIKSVTGIKTTKATSN